MKFGAVDIDAAEGAVLAHSTETPAGRLKKGRRLSRHDIEQLRSAGLASVVAATLEAGDVDEDVAALRIAKASAGANVRIAEAFTGRANIFATADGIVQLDREGLLALNAIDEGITVATLMPNERVSAGQMVATVKIIPFAVPETAVAKAEAIATQCGQIAIADFHAHRVGLVVTRLGSTKASVTKKRIKAIVDRVEGAGSEVASQKVVAHRRADVRDAVRAMRDERMDLILVFGATAIVDREDVIPGGVSDAGGDILHLGMPVDPGNLLLMAKLDELDVVGVPSCASSPKTNGLDWVLERLLADVPVGRDDLANMAVGGLLKEIPTRPQPRAKVRSDKDPRGKNVSEQSGRYAPRIAAVVLASGRSTRMGERNKLAEDYAGKPLVAHAVDAALASVAADVIVVTGHEQDVVRDALSERPVRFVFNKNFADGLATSLVAGISALSNDYDGAVVLLGDMPLITPELVDLLIAAFAPQDGRSICVPFNNGRRGNPVLWSSAFFDELRSLKGDSGARHLIAEHAEDLVEVDVRTDAIFTDIDTPEALAALRDDAPEV